MNSFRESILHPKLVQLYDYWDSIRDDRAMPGRRDMDPLDIPTLLANMVMYDVQHDPLRFRVRLYGTALTKITGNDITGHYLDEPGISPFALLTRPANEKVVLTKTPHLLKAPYPSETGSGGFFYRLCLPLSDDGQKVSMLMNGFYREKNIIATAQQHAAVA